MFERILVAVDASEQSQKAAALTTSLAEKFGSDVLVLHVREKMSSRAGAVDAYEGEQDIELGERIARELAELGVSARFEQPSARFGRVAQSIVAAAEDHGSQVIVMGSRGLSDIGGFLLGSVTHKVVHLAPCPVLIAR
jgi:nucleotide-binding universal stress UspA family protein